MLWKTQKHNLLVAAYLASVGIWAWLVYVLVNESPKVGQAVGMVGVVAFVVSVFPFCIWWWRRLDEASQEAHKSAWFWGGLGGLFIGVLVTQALPWIAPDMLRALTANGVLIAGEGHRGFMLGQVFAMIAAVAGYTVAWACWWWKRR